MNQEEKKQMELLEQAVDLLQGEVDAEDALVNEQKKMIQAQEQHISKLSGLLNQILKP